VDRYRSTESFGFDGELHRLPPAFAVTLPTARRIGVRDIVDRFCPMGSCPGLSHGECAEFIVMHLLQAPRRKPLYMLEEWAEEHSAELMYGEASSKFNESRMGRALDAMSKSITDIETAVVGQAVSVYKVDTQAIHWDLTHVTFTGAYDDIDEIGPGYGGGRLHEKQVKVSLHATNDGGIPVRHQVIPGGSHQAPYAPAMLEDLQERLDRTDLLVISDRAGISYENLVAYRKAKAQCIGALQETAAERELLAAVPLSKFEELSYRAPSAKDGVYRAFDTTLCMERQKQAKPLRVRVLFVHSTRREAEDAAAREKRLEKLEKRLAEIRSYLNKNRYSKRKYALGQIDKEMPAGWEEIVQFKLTGKNKALKLNWSVDEAAFAQLGRFDGRYIVVADVDKELSADRIFQLFKEQNIIEQRFRAMKSDIIIHPVWLHKKERIQALLLVYVLALIVYTIIELCSVRAGLSTKRYHKMTARELIHRFGVVDMVELRIRGQPTKWKLKLSRRQRELLQRLRLPTPDTYLNPN
jgi:transposase